MGLSGQSHAKDAFSPWERDPVPTIQEAGWVPGPLWTGAENVAPTRIGSPDLSESLYRLSCPCPQIQGGTSRKAVILNSDRFPEVITKVKHVVAIVNRMLLSFYK